MASPNVDNLEFISTYPIDKIVLTGTTTITNDGDTKTTGSSTGYQSARIVSQSITNTYGKRCFCRFSWSVDGVNFNSEDTRMLFSFTVTLTDIPVTSTPLSGLRAGVSVGISDSTITFYTGNGFHGNVSKLSTDPSTTGYTPTSQDFTINYALFSVE